MHPAPPLISLGCSTHPNDDAVVPLKNGDELVPPQNLRLVQGPKSAKHLDAAFVVGLRHGGRRRGAGASLRLHGVVCAPKEGSAELGSRRRTGDLSLGPRKQLGHPDEGALSVSCGTGCGDLGVWSSLRAVPLRPSRCSRAAGLGGARRSSEGGVSFAGGEPHWTATTQRWSLAHLALRSLRLADNHVLTPSPHNSLRYRRPVCSFSDSTYWNR